MAIEHELTPSGYISHHLSNNTLYLGDGEFWALNLDSLVVAGILGVVVFGLLWLVARGATSGVPTKRQAFIELVFSFVDNQVKSIFHGDRHKFIAPLAFTVFIWALVMNMMDFLPIDVMSWVYTKLGLDPWRGVPTADVNTTFALALSVWLLMIIFGISVKGFGGWLRELFCAPFGSVKLFKPKSFMGFIGLLASPLLPVANFLFNVIEYVSKPLSHSLRLFGNMYAGEVIFLLLGMWAATGLVGTFFGMVLGLGWAIFHILIVTLHAFIFMVLAAVYLSMAHDSH